MTDTLQCTSHFTGKASQNFPISWSVNPSICSSWACCKICFFCSFIYANCRYKDI